MYSILQQATVTKLKVSIVTPMYNVADFIEEQVQSLVNQTMSEIEIILVDDGSTDETLPIVSRLGEAYPEKLTIIKQSNAGAASARNVGLSVFRGDYLLFVDADDVLAHDAIEKMHQAAIGHQADIVTGRSLSFNSTNSWYIPGHYNSGLMNPGEKTLVTNPEMMYSLGPASKLFKRSIVETLRMPTHIEIGEDQPFVLEALLKSKKIVTIDAVVYYYRAREAEEASLSQVVKVDPVRTFTNLTKSLAACLPLFDRYIDNPYDREKTSLYYFNRVTRADFWPAVIEVLKQQKATDQQLVFQEIMTMTHQLPAFYFGQSTFYFQMIILEFIERFTFIQDSAKSDYIKMMQDTLKRIDGNVYAFLDEHPVINDSHLKMKAVKKSIQKQTTRPIFTYLAKRKLKKMSMKMWNMLGTMARKAKTLVTTTFLRRVLYPVYKVTLKKELVLFLTNKDEQLAGSFKPVYEEMLKQGITEEVRFHFKKNPRTLKEQHQLLKDMARSKLIFLDDYYRQLYGLTVSKDTRVVQLWHAAGAFKKFGFSAIGSLDANTPAFETAAHQSYTEVICSSETIRGAYAEAFDVPVDHVLPLGVPRTDKLVNTAYQESIRNEFFGKYPQIKGRKVVTYAPTFRGGPGERQTFRNRLDMRRFIEKYSDDYILVMKMHPSVKNGITIYKDMEGDILNLSQMDMNDLLICTDVLITDYSSVIFDYSLMKKPMLFYAYDLEDYTLERSFYEEYERFVPGPIAKNSEELFDLIDDINNIDLDKISDFSTTYFENIGTSSVKIVHHFFDELTSKDATSH